MATYYSNNFGGDGKSSLSTRDAFAMVPSHWGSSAHNFRSGLVTALATTSDVIRVIKDVASNTQIWALFASANDASAAGAFNVGVHDTEENGGGAIDADLFGSAIAKNVNRLEILCENGATIATTDRGNMLWQMLGLSADPKKSYDITITPSTTFTTTALRILLELEIGKA